MSSEQRRLGQAEAGARKSPRSPREGQGSNGSPHRLCSWVCVSRKLELAVGLGLQPTHSERGHRRPGQRLKCHAKRGFQDYHPSLPYPSHDITLCSFQLFYHGEAVKCIFVHFLATCSGRSAQRTSCPFSIFLSGNSTFPHLCVAHLYLRHNRLSFTSVSSIFLGLFTFVFL